MSKLIHSVHYCSCTMPSGIATEAGLPSRSNDPELKLVRAPDEARTYSKTLNFPTLWDFVTRPMKLQHQANQIAREVLL